MTLRLEDLSHDERLALVAALRLVVQRDGRVSSPEAGALQTIAVRLGSSIFWRTMSESQANSSDEDSLLHEAQSVQRDAVRQFVYDCAREVAEADGIDPREADLIERLRLAWGLAPT